LQDYRSEEVGILKASGQTEEQIESYFVPKTASERRKQKLSQAEEFEQMKTDVAFLLEEVKQLRGDGAKVTNTKTKENAKAPDLPDIEDVEKEY
jgi:uncharacterized protein YnzC (UPF0291/DUF896 family)